MFSFFKKKAPPAPASAEPGSAEAPADPKVPPPAPSNAGSSDVAPGLAAPSWLGKLGSWGGLTREPLVIEPTPKEPQPEAPSLESRPVVAPARPEIPRPAVAVAAPASADELAVDERRDWIARLRSGLRRTGGNIAQAFTIARIGDELYEELETALLQADAGVKATEHLLDDLKQRVRQSGTTDPGAVKGLLADAIADLLAPLQRSLQVGKHTPTVIMVVGVNGAGKTTTIGKLTRHLVDAGQKVLLAAADTFRAAAREQLAVWAERADDPAAAKGRVEIVSQEGGDPAGVTYDAVVAGKARGCDVVIADTAGRLTTQAHLMEELKKIRRVIAKAEPGAPHEVLLVLDGNTGQNALAQLEAFDAALQVTGLVVTKLDGTARGGVLAAVALWARNRPRPPAVYFIGVGEKLEDLQTFDAREFANALLA